MMYYIIQAMVQETLEKTKVVVWPVIENYLKDPVYPAEFALSKKFKKEIDLFWKINCVYPERQGKYLRPTLVLLTAQALGLPASKATLTAAAMQMSQEWLLIHDDIEDDSALRRDKPTLHKLYSPDLALNAGDELHAIMWKMVSDIGINEITEEFYRILLRTILGQGVEQIWTEAGTGKIAEDEYFFIADSKSAYYTIAGPMRLGAILASATPTQIDKITQFGLHLGRCFQLVDDILDYKQDKIEGKLTLANTKGVDYTRRLATKEKNLAEKIFNKDLGFLKKEPARTELNELIDFILERKY